MTPFDEQACRLCGGATRFVFSKTLRARHEVRYFDCPHCGYLQTETPHWLADAYAEAINTSDTGILARNQANVGRVVMTLLAFGRLRGTVVDHAGGFGILVRLLRDAGVEARWADKYADNLVARGFEADDRPSDLITAFEVLEHLVDPVVEIGDMLARAPRLLVTTELVTDRTGPLPQWWYLGTEHGQHIGFFRPRTLQVVAQRLNCHVRSDGRATHLFSREPIPRGWLFLMRHRRWWRVVARWTLRSKTSADQQALAQRPAEPG